MDEKQKSKNDLKLALELINVHHRGRICPECKAHIDYGSKHIITCKYHEIDMKARNL